MITIRRGGRIVSQSRNARGIIRHAGRTGWPVTRVHVLGLPNGGALLRVRWKDGSYSVAPFQSATVARMFAQARRGWPPHRWTPPPHCWAASLRGDA